MSVGSHYAKHLVGTMLLMMCISIFPLYSASALKSFSLYGNTYHFVLKQCTSCSLALALSFVLLKIPFRFLERCILPLSFLCVLVLAAIFVPGAYKTVGGAARWLNLGFMYVQPSEFAKVVLIFFLAKNLARESANIHSFRYGIFPNLLIVAVWAGLIMRQPDFGTAFLMLSVSLVMIFVAGAHLKVFAALLGTGAVFAVSAVLAAPYRMRRLTSFLDPWADFREGGFQIIQSYLGFQNGGLSGVGLGESRQRLAFLPEAHTDFIYSVIGEEMGFLGVLLLILLFARMLYIGYAIALLQQDRFKKYLATGLISMIAVQSSLNLSVVMGVLPTKGIPLPFISSGSSSLIVCVLSIALLVKIALSTDHQTSTDFLGRS